MEVNMETVAEMARDDQKLLRNSATATVLALAAVNEEFPIQDFPSTGYKAGKWTTAEGIATWCVTRGNFLMYPDSVVRKTIGGGRPMDGWVVVRMETATSAYFHGEDQEPEESPIVRYEATDWLSALKWFHMRVYEEAFHYKFEVELVKVESR